MGLTQTSYEIDRGIATITLHRPDRMNAFTPVMHDELITIFAEADMDDAVRVGGNRRRKGFLCRGGSFRRRFYL